MTDDRPWAPATAAALVAWPALAEPLVDALAAGRPTGAAVGALADKLTARMIEVAQDAARMTAAEAASHGVDSPGGEPDEDRIAKLAATFAAVIASGYGSVALQATLGVPLTEAGRLKAGASAVAAAVRTALTALGVAVSGLVPAQVGAAMAAAEHEGTVSVFEAHPPRYLVAVESHLVDRCEPCTDVNGKRYDTLAEALEDYPNVGYRACRGGSTRCRGRLRGVWGEDPGPFAESAPTEVSGNALQLLHLGDPESAGTGRGNLTAPLIENDSPIHTGAMLALVPTADDAARLAVEGGEDPYELHLTLAYLGKADQLDAAARQDLIAAVTAACNGMPIVEAEATGPALFNPGGDEPCLVALVGGDLLDAVHHYLLETVSLPPVMQHAPWQPHVTLRFGTDVLRLAGMAGALAGRMKAGQIGTVRFDRLRIAIGGETIDIPLLPDEFTDDDGFEAWLAGEGLTEADVHPGHGQLKRYWLGKGASKWVTSPHPWTALYRHLRKFITNPVLLKKTVSRWYVDHFGHSPNQSRGKTLTERYNPGQLRDLGGEHGGEWTATPGMSWDKVIDSYGPAVDEAEAGDFTVAVFQRGDFTLFHRQGDHYEAIRELDDDYAGELAGRLDEFADDAENADPDEFDPDKDAVDYVHIGDNDALVGRTTDAKVLFSASKSGDREPDLHVVGNRAADQFLLDPDNARDLAQALRDMVERYDEVNNGDLVEGPAKRRARRSPPMRSRNRRLRVGQRLAERYDPSQPRNHSGEWTRVLAAADLKVGKSTLRLTHHGGGRVSVHDEHGGALHLTRNQVASGRHPGSLRRFAYNAPVKTDNVGDREFMGHLEDRDGMPWTTAVAGLHMTHRAEPGLSDDDEPYLRDRHTLHLPAGGKGVDDPDELFTRPGTPLTAKELGDLADTLLAFADGHEDVDTGKGSVTMGVTGKEFTFDTGRRADRPIVLNRGELRNVEKALTAAADAHDPDEAEPLPAGEAFKRTIATKGGSGDIVVTRTGPDSDFWIESDFTAVRITPAALQDVLLHIGAMLALSGDLKHLTPVTVRPVVEAAAPASGPQPISLAEVSLPRFAPAA